MSLLFDTYWYVGKEAFLQVSTLNGQKMPESNLTQKSPQPIRSQASKQLRAMF